MESQKSKSGQRHDPDAQIQQAEIERAVARSGYPLEIRLLEIFEAANMRPQIGTLVRSGEMSRTKDNLSTREIDIVANLSHRLPLGPATEKGQDAIHATFSVVVAAKNLAPSAALVGFKWRGVPKKELQLLRCQVGGAPTTVLDGYPEANQITFADGGLSDAFAPLADVPVCVQWAIARRDDPMEQEKRYWRDLDVLVRTEWTNAVAATLGCLGGRGPAKVLLFQLPVLVVATKTLQVYGALENKYEQLDWFVLRRTFDLGDRMGERLVDVVTESGLPKLIDASKRTMAGIIERISARSDEIASIATAQHAKYQHAQQQAAYDAAVAARRGY